MEKRGPGMDTHMGDDPLELAAYDTVHDYPGGAEALVKVIGGSAEVLRNQVSLRIKTHKLGLVQARQIVLAAKDTRIAEQLSRDCGGVFVPLEKFEATGDVGLLQQQLRMTQAGGSFAAVLDKALEDGDITDAEYRQCEDAMTKQIQEGEGMLARLRAWKDRKS